MLSPGENNFNLLTVEIPANIMKVDNSLLSKSIAISLRIWNGGTPATPQKAEIGGVPNISGAKFLLVDPSSPIDRQYKEFPAIMIASGTNAISVRSPIPVADWKQAFIDSPDADVILQIDAAGIKRAKVPIDVTGVGAKFDVSSAILKIAFTNLESVGINTTVEWSAGYGPNGSTGVVSFQAFQTQKDGDALKIDFTDLFTLVKEKNLDMRTRDTTITVTVLRNCLTFSDNTTNASFRARLFTSKAVTITSNKIRLTVTEGNLSIAVKFVDFQSSTDNKTHTLNYTDFTPASGSRTITLGPTASNDRPFTDVSETNTAYPMNTHVIVIPAPKPFLSDIDFTNSTGGRLDTYVPQRFAVKFAMSVPAVSGFEASDVQLRHYDFKTGKVTAVPAQGLVEAVGSTGSIKRLVYNRTWASTGPGLLVLEIDSNKFQYSSTETRGNDRVRATHYVGRLPF
eukprot:jgi/Mesvir1/6774/Mv03087-RA.1